jgi:hypothetical protein
MGVLEPKFYQVAKPFDYYIQLGHRWANTWIGRSQCSELVLDPGEAGVGQIFHDLPGGLFTSGDAAAVSDIGHVARMVQPKHIFERSYGPDPDRMRFLQLIKEGFLVEIEKPAERPDYNAWTSSQTRC